MKHILVGETGQEDSVLKASRNDRPLDWRVPKESHPNDSVLFYLPRHGFVAYGEIASQPRNFEHRRYTAKIRAVKLLASAVPLEFVKKAADLSDRIDTSDS